MPREFQRTERVGEQIRRELAAIIRDRLDDRRLAMVSITEVWVSRDLAQSRVYVTFLGDDQEQRRQVVSELNRAAGFLRGELGRRMRIRTVPRLQFRYDESVERGAHLDALISGALGEDRARHGDEPADDAGEPEPPGETTGRGS